MLRAFDAGWLSGLIDGEGCLGVYKVRRLSGKGFQWHIGIQITNNSRRLLERACKLLKAGTIYRHGKGKAYCYYLASRRVLEEILPQLLLIVKRLQAVLLLRALRLARDGKHDALLQKIYERVRSLNGHKPKKGEPGRVPVNV